MSYVLSLTTPLPEFQALTAGVIKLALEYPAETARALPGGLAEIDAAKVEAAALADAEVEFRARQGEEIVAREAKDKALEAAQGWFTLLRDKSLTLAEHEPAAAALGRVVSPFPRVSKLREVELSFRVVSLARAVAPHIAVLESNGYPAATLAQAEGLAAALHVALLDLAEKSSLRNAASGARDAAKETVLRRLQRLTDLLGPELPDKGKDRLASLRQTWLPLYPSAPEAAPAPTEGDSEGETP